MTQPTNATTEPVASPVSLDTPGGAAAYGKMLEAGNLAARQVVLINRRLTWIADELRRIQPTSPGSVLLDMRDCGKGCMGCPHPRWIKWYAPRHNAELKLLGMRLTGDPALSLTRTGKFKDIYPELLARVAEGKRLIKDKARLVETFAIAKRIVTS